MNKLIFEYKNIIPEIEIDEEIKKFIPEKFLRKTLNLPDLTELDVIRHFTILSKKNYSVDTHFYPLGSCTMKYNPRINEKIANFDGFKYLHPYQPEDSFQGILEVLYELQNMLCEICGMDAFSLQPSAGAQGELTGILIIHKYLKMQGVKKKLILIPDSSHGTNPATAAGAGFEVVTIKSNSKGQIDLNDLKNHLNDNVACLMLTNPNTLGVFEENILEISELVHKSGGLLYYDGANLNALCGICRAGDMGFDIVHINLHKTFSTPHGGGGPGSGPVGVKKNLKDFLPIPLIKKENNIFSFDYSLKNSIGKLRSFYGNIPVLLKAYAYIKLLGFSGLKENSIRAVLNANYLLKKLKSRFKTIYDNCMHEFVLSCEDFNKYGVHSIDIAKRLLDLGFYAPTVNFPLIIKEALLIEPTETESKDTLDNFVKALEKIVQEINENSDLVKGAPHTTPVKRLDEVGAARNPDLRWKQCRSSDTSVK